MSDTPDTDLKLIKAIERRPFLYDKSKSTQNEAYIKKTWTQISQELKLPKDYCISQWKYLRTRYTRSAQSKWSLAPHLNFLEPFIQRRPKKDQTELADGPSMSDNVKEIVIQTTTSISSKPSAGVKKQSTKSQSSKEIVVPKTAATKVQKKNEKPNSSPVKNVQPKPKPASSVLEKQSHQSFCESLSNDLLTLTADQQMKCRIDILTTINKYKNPTNKKASKSDAKIDSAGASDLSKRFATISEKITKGTMKSFDEDWLLVFTVKNFFCKLMEIRKTNAELDRMLPSFKSVDSTTDSNDQGDRIAYGMKFENGDMHYQPVTQAQFYKEEPEDSSFYAGNNSPEHYNIKTEPKYSDYAYSLPSVNNLPLKRKFKDEFQGYY